MDKFKCAKCGKIFDEFEADYNFMSRKGKELCPECIKKGYNTMSRCSICQAPKVLCTCKDEAEIIGIEEVKKQYQETDYIRGLKAGIRLYAWWKDGLQYVGTCGTTLKHALETIDKENNNDL
jgi:hypothetical protein